MASLNKASVIYWKFAVERTTLSIRCQAIVVLVLQLDDRIKYFKFQIVYLENILCKKVFKVLTAKIKRIKHILPCSKHKSLIQ